MKPAPQAGCDSKVIAASIFQTRDGMTAPDQPASKRNLRSKAMLHARRRSRRAYILDKGTMQDIILSDVSLYDENGHSQDD
jgi:hypothetical protein